MSSEPTGLLVLVIRSDARANSTLVLSLPSSAIFAVPAVAVIRKRPKAKVLSEPNAEHNNRLFLAMVQNRHNNMDTFLPELNIYAT